MARPSHQHSLALLPGMCAALLAVGCATARPGGPAPVAPQAAATATPPQPQATHAAWRNGRPQPHAVPANPAQALEHARREGRAFVRRRPAVGDAAYFRDVRQAGLVTLAARVEAVLQDGTVVLLARVKTGAVRLRMNLDHPTLRRDPRTHRVLNHYLAGGRDGVPPRTTAQLFVSYAASAPSGPASLASR